MTLDRLTKSLFGENLNTIFRLQIEPTRAIDLELIELHEGRPSARQEQFALLFRGPLATPLEQGTWPLAHEVLGQFDLFLVPVDRDQQGMYYEAIFNRFIQA